MYAPPTGELLDHVFATVAKIQRIRSETAKGSSVTMVPCSSWGRACDYPLRPPLRAGRTDEWPCALGFMKGVVVRSPARQEITREQLRERSRRAPRTAAVADAIERSCA